MLTPERLNQDIRLLHEFRKHLEDFHAKRVKLKQLQENVERNWMMGMDLNTADAIQKDLMSQLMAARREVGRRIHDVMEIIGRYPLPTVLKIFPPPMLGGYVSTLNIFQAFIDLQLPHDFELDPNKVFDLVDQAIWACERDLRQFQGTRAERPPDPVNSIAAVEATTVPSATSDSSTGCWTSFTVIASLASIVSIIGLVALWPKPSIDRDISLDENNPFEVQFKVRNSSPVFDLYSVSPACELIKVEIGDSTFTQSTLVHPDTFQPRLPAGGATSFTCHLPPPFKLDSASVFRTGEVILKVDYRIFNRISSSVKQRIVLAHDKSGKPVWLFEGLKE